MAKNADVAEQQQQQQPAEQRAQEANVENKAQLDALVEKLSEQDGSGVPPQSEYFYRRVAQRYLERRGVLQRGGTVLFCKLAGSMGYNLSSDQSDWDFSGVYSEHIDTIAGLGVATDSLNSSENEKPDFVMHEARKVCLLLIKGNPGIIEMLYSDHFAYISPAWHALRQHRRSFLTITAMKQYLGYINSQMRMIERGVGKTDKKLYHCHRLLSECERIVAGKEPVVYFDPSDPEYQYIMDIRSSKVSGRAAMARVAERVLAIENAKPWNLPQDADKAVLNQWLVDLRHQRFN